jgi:hypothetical protein
MLKTINNQNKDLIVLIIVLRFVVGKKEITIGKKETSVGKN